MFSLATRRPVLLGEEFLLAGLLFVSLLLRSNDVCLEEARTVDRDLDLADMVTVICLDVPRL